MHIKDFLEAINFEVTGGEKYCWDCFGKDARYMDFEIDLNTSISAVYSTKNQQVFEITATNVFWRKAYAWYDPEYKDAYLTECDKRGVNEYQAFDDVSYEVIISEKEVLDKVANLRHIAKLTQATSENE